MDKVEDNVLLTDEEKALLKVSYINEESRKLVSSAKLRENFLG